MEENRAQRIVRGQAENTNLRRDAHALALSDLPARARAVTTSFPALLSVIVVSSSYPRVERDVSGADDPHLSQATNAQLLNELQMRLAANVG